jgi:acyl-coenzyme A thioesterase PaaI-like protein
MAIQRPADARPVVAHAFRGFNGLIGHEVVAWRPGFVEMSLKVRPELCNANGLLHGGVLMTLLDSAAALPVPSTTPRRPGGSASRWPSPRSSSRRRVTATC